MATITITTNSKTEAKSILAKVYESDKIGGYTQNGNAFSGSVLTASIHNNIVTIQSNYYSENTLKTMFND